MLPSRHREMLNACGQAVDLVPLDASCQPLPLLGAEIAAKCNRLHLLPINSSFPFAAPCSWGLGEILEPC